MLDKLEYLVALARERHFGKAALSLGVTQPTLSAGLKQLEERFGATLVDRGARFKSLTPEGERVLVWARRILDDVRSLEIELDAAKATVGGRLRIVAVPTALSWLPRLTVPFLTAHPGVTLEIGSRTGAEVLEAVRHFDADVGITYLTHEAVVGFAHHALLDERYCLLTRPDGPLAGSATVDWSELATIPIALLDPSMQNRRILDESFTALGIRVAPVMETNSMITLIAHVRAGGCATILPEGMADALGLGSDFTVVPLGSGGPVRTLGLVVASREPRPFLPASFFAFAASHTFAR
ncbi:LysR family transcriptional regulator [Aureimonas pseudogalii]|uniref:DNA-binding transcriptional LysR family regulator n=1 Tax=Aureimonas pseudogalii TaxID=1744844 RepID=A0A7W6H446_9HYPH|nr:LysR family transcriptional regulator [Aureimonas pseudogalii]MBB3998450.1 DNA-binding transcriptional LysR family regulator [Aureimonas pseudogalii]